MTDNPPIRKYVTKIDNKVTFKNNTRCYLELLMPGTMKLLESCKIKITKDKNGGMISQLY